MITDPGSVPVVRTPGRTVNQWLRSGQPLELKDPHATEQEDTSEQPELIEEES
ncbi:hypothetical protein AB0H49_34040 [Nocardia sp. NPDC050713]|uniref:hypothetical protein n=1 Tax=Nocardia sp. NPDC050713 TaxID=3154511 RepID=UPI0033EBB4E5